MSKASQPKNDLWDKLGTLTTQPDLVRDPNTFTAMEYAERFNICRSAAKTRLAKLAAAGKLEHVKILIVRSDGVVQPVHGYRLNVNA